MGWRDRPPPGPLSVVALAAAVVVGVLMVGVGWWLAETGGAIPRSPSTLEVTRRIARIFTVPGVVVVAASVAALVLRRRRAVLARGLMVVAAVGLVLAGLVAIVGVVGLPMLVVGLLLGVAAFNDDEPGPQIRAYR